MNKAEYKKQIKAKRLTGSWYQFVGIVEGKAVRLKGYKTWLQIYTIDGTSYSNGMEGSVSQFNYDLLEPFN